MKLWITRDTDGTCYIHNKEPDFIESEGIWVCGVNGGESMECPRCDDVALLPPGVAWDLTIAIQAQGVVKVNAEYGGRSENNRSGD